MMEHPFLPNTKKDSNAMLDEIGRSLKDLFADIPLEIRNKDHLRLPESHTEEETFREVRRTLNQNKTTMEAASFLGGGIYSHYVPAVVGSIIGRSEFLTSYTPYAPEISQGMLQALWEYQSLICELTGTDTANSSMYDWASALGEAALMSARVTRRNQFIIPRSISNERRTTLETYAKGAGLRIIEVPFDKQTGELDFEMLESTLTHEVAGVYLETPNYFGIIEQNASQIADLAHGCGAIFVVGADPISLGIFEAPGNYGADIVIGEGQSLGLAMNFGGPLLGIFTIRSEGNAKMLRAMPGRVIGLTTVKNSDKRAFCMTLQTREQHIRRERATSNICTNEALCALASAVYLSLLGPEGIKNLAEVCWTKTNDLCNKISLMEDFLAPLFSGTHFNEFILKLDESKGSYKELRQYLLTKNIFGGISLIKDFPELGESSLWSVTETNSSADFERLLKALDGYKR